MAPAGNIAVLGGPGGAVVGGAVVCGVPIICGLGGAGVVTGGFSSGISMKEPVFFKLSGGPSSVPAFFVSGGIVGGPFVAGGPKGKPLDRDPVATGGGPRGGPDKDPLGGCCGAGRGGLADAAASTNSLRDLGAGGGSSIGPSKSGRQRWRKPVKPLTKAFRVSMASFRSVGLTSGLVGRGCSTFSATASWHVLRYQASTIG